MTDMIEVTNCTDSQSTAGELSRLLTDALKSNQKVLWLISGGSSIPIAVAAARLFGDVDQSNLWVTLVDDMYGVEEVRTNWLVLREQGFSVRGGNSRGVIEAASSLEAAGSYFAEFLSEKLEWADFAIGQFGLGAGQHTGGIQPGSAAAREDKKLAIGYLDGTVGRVTVTPALIARLDVAFINSFGEEKRPLVEQFLKSKATIQNEPTQALKRAKRTLLVSDILPKN